MYRIRAAPGQRIRNHSRLSINCPECSEQRLPHRRPSRATVGSADPSTLGTLKSTVPEPELGDRRGSADRGPGISRKKEAGSGLQASP